MKTLSWLAALLVLGAGGCMTVNDRGPPTAQVSAQDSAASRLPAAPPPHRQTPWDYRTYPFGE